MNRQQLADALRLLLITDDALLGDRDVLAVCAAAVRGGATAVQVRLKHVTDPVLLRLTRELIRDLRVPVFVNDRLDVALAAGAAGVHLGPDDVAPALARRIAPPGFVIGASVANDAESVRGSAADYWGIGALHGSATKLDAGEPIGMTGAGRWLALAGGRPCVVVGGVQPEDVPDAWAAGFAGVAVIGGILRHHDIEAATRRYVVSALVAEATARRTTP